MPYLAEYTYHKNVKKVRDALSSDFAETPAQESNSAQIPPSKKKPMPPNLPEPFITGKHATSSQDTMGVSWMQGSKKYIFKGNATKIPMWQFSCFYYAFEGEESVMLAPIVMIHKGGSSMLAYNSMLQGLTPANANTNGYNQM